MQACNMKANGPKCQEKKSQFYQKLLFTKKEVIEEETMDNYMSLQSRSKENNVLYAQKLTKQSITSS